MLKKITNNDIDKMMDFWKSENIKSNKAYRNKDITDEYNHTQNQFSENIKSTTVYTEDDELYGYISINNQNQIWGILVKSTIRREGIGSVLVEQCQKTYKNLNVRVPRNDKVAIKFFEKNGFKINQEEENATEKTILMVWNKNESSSVKLVYFDEDIDKKYLENNNLSFTYESIKVSDFDKQENMENHEVKNIKTYMKIRKKIESIMNAENILLYIDYNNYNNYLDEQIKEIVKIKRINLSVVICEPFSIENSKKDSIIKEIEKSYKGYNIIKIDCTFDDLEEDIAVNQIFQKRMEILLEKIKGITENV